MNCINDQQLFDFINKELPSEEHGQIEFHLKNCSDCQTAYNYKKEEVCLLKDSLKYFAYPKEEIPKFIFPGENKIQKASRISSHFVRVGIAATILLLISFTIIFLNLKKQKNVDLQSIYIEKEFLITDMNEAWHNRELIFTSINSQTGKTEVFLSSEHKN